MTNGSMEVSTRRKTSSSGYRYARENDYEFDVNDISRASTPTSTFSSKSEGRKRDREHRYSVDDYKRKIARLRSELDLEKAKGKKAHKEKTSELREVRESYEVRKQAEIDGLEHKMKKRIEKERRQLEENLRSSIMEEKDKELQQVMKYKEDELKEMRSKFKREKESAIKLAVDNEQRVIEEKERQMKEELEKMRKDKEKLQSDYKKKCTEEARKEKEFTKIKEDYDAELRRILGESKKLALGNLEKLKKAEKALSENYADSDDDELHEVDFSELVSDLQSMQSQASSRAVSRSVSTTSELKMDEINMNINNLLASPAVTPGPVGGQGQSLTPGPIGHGHDHPSPLTVIKELQSESKTRSTSAMSEPARDIFSRKPDEKDRQLQKKVVELQTQTQRLERKIALLKTENETILKFSDVFNSLKGTGAIEDQKPAEKRQRTTFSTSKLTRVQEWCDQSFRTVICSKRSDGRRNMKQCVDNRSNLAKQRSVLKAAENKSEDGSGVSDAIDNGAGVPELQSHSRKSVPALSSNLTNRRSVLNEAENQSEDGSEWLPTESDFSDDVDNDSVGHESQLESRKSFPALSSNVAKQRSVLNEAENKSEDGSEWLPSESDISGDLKNDSVVPDSHSQSDLSDVFPVLNQVAAVTVDTPQEKYKWDKKHCCLYCKKMVNKMSRHLTRKHKNELDVQKAQHFPINSKERRQAFINILHEGDYEHNYDVYRTDTGEVIPKYRKANRKPDDFVACSHCKGLYLRQLISKHYKRCPKNHSKIKYKKGEAARVGKMMLPVSLKVSTSFYHDVIGCMRSDDVSRLVKGDSLILKLGERLYGRRDVEEHTAGNVSSCLRILGRLVEILRRKSEMDVSSLLAGLDPVNFDLLISCIKELAGFEEATHSFQKPSVALKLGYALKKCSKIVVAEAGKYNDRDLEDKMLRFDRLIDGEWYDAISACASQSASMSKMNVPKLIPSLADVGKVNEELKKDLVSDDYGTLAKASLGFISIFNRKRGGELQRMKHDEFKIHGSRTTPEQEVLEGLSKAEKKMANILSRMEIKGKFVRPVPILLTPEMIQCLEKLLQLRKENNVVSKYMFARQSGYKPYRGSDVIRHYAMKAKVENPSIFTATSLRKQLATLSQAMEISKLDQDQLAGFLGHDIRVHRNVYRRPMEVMQKAKVASILFKINRGIEIPNEMKEDNLEMEEVEDEPPSADLNLEGDVDSEVSENYDADSTEINREEPCTETVCTNVVSIQRKDAKNSSTHKSPKQQCQKKPRTEVENRSTGRKSPKHKKKPWTEEEISAVKEHLLQCISMNKVPQKYEAEKARTRDRRLSNRTWKDIKYYVYNLVKKQRC